MLLSAISIDPVWPVGPRGRATDLHGPKAGRERAVDDGPRPRRRRGPPLCPGPGNDAGCAAEGEAEKQMGPRRKLFKFAIWQGFAYLTMQSSKLVLSASKREIPCLKGLHMGNLQAKQPPAFSMRSREQ